MNDSEIEAAIAVHEAAIEALRGLKQTRASTSSTAVMSAPATARKQPAGPRRWLLAATAFRRFPFEPWSVRRICADHPEWAMKLRDGNWHVDIDRFNEFADRVEAGELSFAVSEKFAKSVAPEEQIPLEL
jgi:hypothetical protein